MKIVLFCHSLRSDWNHGNAHFLRGLVCELQQRGHSVRSWEPHDSWSFRNLVEHEGSARLRELATHYPTLDLSCYEGGARELEQIVDGADLVVVHEWTPAEVVRELGRIRQRSPQQRLLFHDTHHRSVTSEGELAALDLTGYDGVLAFGETVRERYLRAGWARRVWTFHEAADTRRFQPMPELTPTHDLCWIGNFGDGERTRELDELLWRPAATLGMTGTVHGVRYPPEGLERARQAGLEYRGWLPNFDVPRVFAQHRFTVHIPRAPYVTALPGIPTIRVFEALACGIPLLCAAWQDSEHLFRNGDYLIARNGQEMQRSMQLLKNDAAARQELAARGLESVRARHTCAHRAQQLLDIMSELGARHGAAEAPPAWA